MTRHGDAHRLDTRAWLLWGGAASIPLLTGRHPLVIIQVLLVVLVVRAVCLPPDRARGWGWLVRVGAVAVPIGVLFNVLTVHTGDRELFRLPGTVPMVGGSITVNALVYGLLTGVTIVALIAIGTTVAAGMDWGALMRLLPARAAGIAVAGSVAWAFLPQLATSWREIREAQAARGHRWRGARDIVPLVVPLMAGGLDRSITMAEALESRGFGVAASRQPARRGAAVALGGALTLAVLALYLLASGAPLQAGGGALAATGLAAVALWSGGDPPARITRYRQARWARADSAVAAGALLALAVTVLALQQAPAALRYDPYPTLRWPETSLWLLAALAALLLPAVVAPAPAGREEGAP